MDVATAAEQDEGEAAREAATPFGLGGLLLSLVGLALLGLILAALLCAVAALIALPIMDPAGLLAALKAGLSGSDGALAARLLAIVVLAVYLGLAIAIFIAARWRGGAAWRRLIGWYPFRLGNRRFWIVVALTLLYSAAADAAIGHFLTHPMERLEIPADPAAALGLFVLAVAIAPLTEELLFRGWIYTSLRFSFGFWPALIVTSALFALAHYEKTHLYALAVFPIGLAIGAIRERTGSLKAAMLFHALNNLAAFGLAALAGAGT